MKEFKPLMDSGYEGIIQAMELAESMGIPTQELPWTLESVDRYVERTGLRDIGHGFGTAENMKKLLKPTGWSHQDWVEAIRKLVYDRETELGLRDPEHDELMAGSPTNENRLRQYIRELLMEKTMPIGLCYPFAIDKAKEWLIDGGENDVRKFKVVHGRTTDKWTNKTPG